MADFPASIYAPTVKENRPGVVYDALKTKVIFAEDFNLDRGEIVAIETILGINPQGAYTSVADRIQALEDAPSGGGVWGSITGTLSDQTDLQDALDAKPDLLDIYPVGAVYISVVSTTPATLFGGTWAVFGAGKAIVGLDSGDPDFDTAEETRGEKTHQLTAGESGLVGHNHTQYSHNHTQDSHNHTQNSHNHTQDAHSHAINIKPSVNNSTASGGNAYKDNGTHAINLSFCDNTTATNQATTATNQAVASASAVSAHNNIQPSIVVYMWKRTA